MWLAYELLLVLGWFCYLPAALWRRRLPHPGWSMRLGRYPAGVQAHLAGRRTTWIHAVSVGEVLAAAPLVKAIRRAHPERPIVLSTITASGFDVAAQQLADSGVAVYFPLDLRPCVRRALDALRPDLLILVESEFWPIAVRLATARGIPIAVVNGRISARAFRRYLWVKRWMAGTLARIDLFVMQTQADADRAIALGAPRERVLVAGSTKWDASIGARPTAEAIQETSAHLGLTPQDAVLVAGSTHRGEEGALLTAYRELSASFPTLRLILAPRHLERLGEVEWLIRRAGLTPVRVSQPAASWRVGLVDTFGELPRFYGLATIAFIGGSLIPHGGQNPLEAASLGRAIVFGPHMHNFVEIAERLLVHKAAWQVKGADELAMVFSRMLAHPEEAQAMGHRARELTERSQGTLQRTIEAMEPFLKERRSDGTQEARR